MALELFLYEPSYDIYSAYWSVHNVSRIKREARMSSHRFSTDVKHAALWRENYILFFSSSIIQYTHIERHAILISLQYKDIQSEFVDHHYLGFDY